MRTAWHFAREPTDKHGVRAMQSKLTTTDLARAMGVKPESIRTHVYRQGSYYGIRPIKGPNNRLLWPADAIDRLLNRGGHAA